MCFVFAEMVPIGVYSTLKNGGWEKKEGEACSNLRNSDREVRRAVTGSPEEGLQDEKGLGTMATTPGFLPGESHGQRSLVGYSPCGRKELDRSKQLIHIPKEQFPIINIYGF